MTHTQIFKNARMLSLLALLGAAPLSLGCDVDQTEEGSLPEVDVKEGNMPEYDVDTAEVDVDTKKSEVKVPDVDIGTETKEVETPDIDVDMPDDN